MKPHIYEGNANFCLQCFKVKSDPIHLDIKVDILDSHGIVLNEGPLCPGHACVKCKRDWFHDYRCNRTSVYDVLCESCCRQSAADINRPSNLDLLTNQSLTGRDIVQIELEHDEFIVLNILHKPDGSINPDWREQLVDHIKNLESMIQKLRVKLSISYRKKADQEYEEVTRLSPEERKSFEDAVRKGKSVEKAKVKIAKSSEEKKADWAAMLAKIASTIAKQTGMSESAAMEMAKKNIGDIPK